MGEGNTRSLTSYSHTIRGRDPPTKRLSPGFPWFGLSQEFGVLPMESRVSASFFGSCPETRPPKPPVRGNSNRRWILFCPSHGRLRCLNLTAQRRGISSVEHPGSQRNSGHARRGACGWAPGLFARKRRGTKTPAERQWQR